MSNSSSTTKKINNIKKNTHTDVNFNVFFTDFDKNEKESESKDIRWINPNVIAKTLSQKRPTLTSTTPTVQSIKKFKPHESEEEILPKYLSTTNKLFEESISTHITLEELRQLVCENEVDKPSILQQQLQCPLATSSSSIGPENLKSFILDDPDVLPTVKNNIHNSTCLNYVNQMLTQVQQESSLSYQRQIEEKRQYLPTNFTLELEQMLKDLVKDYGTSVSNILNEGFIAITTTQENNNESNEKEQYEKETQITDHSNQTDSIHKSNTYDRQVREDKIVKHAMKVARISIRQAMSYMKRLMPSHFLHGSAKYLARFSSIYFMYHQRHHRQRQQK